MTHLTIVETTLISFHAFTWRATCAWMHQKVLICVFQSTHSHGVRQDSSAAPRSPRRFQSTHSHGVRLGRLCGRLNMCYYISIHALTWSATRASRKNKNREEFHDLDIPMLIKSLLQSSQFDIRKHFPFKHINKHPKVLINMFHETDQVRNVEQLLLNLHYDQLDYVFHHTFFDNRRYHCLSLRLLCY